MRKQLAASQRTVATLQRTVALTRSVVSTAADDGSSDVADKPVGVGAPSVDGAAAELAPLDTSASSAGSGASTSTSTDGSSTGLVRDVKLAMGNLRSEVTTLSRQRDVAEEQCKEMAAQLDALAGQLSVVGEDVAQHARAAAAETLGVLTQLLKEGRDVVAAGDAADHTTALDWARRVSAVLDAELPLPGLKPSDTATASCVLAALLAFCGRLCDEKAGLVRRLDDAASQHAVLHQHASEVVSFAQQCASEKAALVERLDPAPSKCRQ